MQKSYHHHSITIDIPDSMNEQDMDNLVYHIIYAMETQSNISLDKSVLDSFAKATAESFKVDINLVYFICRKMILVILANDHSYDSYI